MTPYDDLLEWAVGRPWWQQQVLVRLAQGDNFTTADYEEIVDGLLRGAPPTPKGGWLATMQPPQEARTSPVSLVGIREVSNINRLAGAQELTFAETGITVIYGHNGSGKSGYARLIKQLVRTRHRDPILPDIFTAPEGTQTAELLYRYGTETRTATLEHAPIELRQIAFYDERCGDAYLTTEGEATYRPSALRLLDELVAVCDGVRAVLDQRLAENAARREPLPQLPPDTMAGTFLRSLSAATSANEIAQVCTAPEDADTRLARTQATEAELRASDPARERDRLTHLSGAYRTLGNHLQELDRRLGADAQSSLRLLQQQAVTTRAAADAVSSTNFDDEPLSGVGQETWRQLWAAAERYSVSIAYPEQPFPVVNDRSHCVLCQQVLAPDAQERLARFHRFMTDDTEARAEHAARDLASARSAISATQIEAPAVAVALDNISGDEEAVRVHVSNALQAWSERKTAMLSDGDELASPPTGAREECERRSSELQDQGGRIDASAFTERINALRAEQTELTARLTLSASREAVVREQHRLTEQAALHEARRQTDTRGISRASGELTSRHVTVLVQDRFSRESQDLRVDSVTLLGQGVKHGSVRHKPGFVGAVVTAEIPQVLSEGEQTALGLAGFFVEAHLDDTKSALVFDDPVTSLDHIRRGHVASRLVTFAADRQVVVFTHDVVFAAELKRAAGEKDVQFTARSIERRGATQVPGYCHEGHPWSAQDAQARLGTLKQELVRLRKQEGGRDADTREREVGAWAGRLSETWERFVSQDLAGAVFDRGTQEVRPMMLKVIAQFSEEDNKEFQEAYKRVSRWATRHDKDTSLIYVAPTMDELEQELAVAEHWYARVRKYKNRSN